MRNYRTVLRELLEEQGLSQKGLADKIGTTEATISRSLSGVNVPNVKIVAAIADALNVSLDYLMGRSMVSRISTVRDNEQFIVGSVFSRCTARDREIVLCILREYMTEPERRFFEGGGMANGRSE